MEISDTEFEQFVDEGFAALPEKFKKLIDNVIFKVENEPSKEVRETEGLQVNDTLLGYYHGVPNDERGEHYHGLLPDTIYIYKKPIIELAEENTQREPEKCIERVKEIVKDTVWHEVGHHFGLDEEEVEKREKRRGIWK